MKFCENLKKELEQHKLSQEKFAEKLFTTQATISRWLSGVNEPDLETLLKICEILECSPNELLGWRE